MFDFSITTRNEGDTLGQNDKGLITRDRQTKKDSFYFYQANWNDPSRTWANTPVLYISDHTWTDRATSSASMTVFSNLGAPTLWKNGVLIGTMVPLVLSGITIPHTYTMSSNLALAAGATTFKFEPLTTIRPTPIRWSGTTIRPRCLGTPYARVDFTDSTANLQSGYVADTGQAFNGIYGWVNSTTLAALPTLPARIIARRRRQLPLTKSTPVPAFMLPTNGVWQYSLPNGLYDVHIVSADSTNPNIVNNISVNGNLLHDIDSTDFGDNGFDEFYATVTVTNGFLRVSAGSGSVSPVLAYIDINAVTPPSVISSNFQHAGPSSCRSSSARMWERALRRPI